MSRIKARLTLLTPDRIADVHEMAVTILEKTGIRVDDADSRAVFEKALGKSTGDNRVFISRELLDWAIEAAPSAIDVCKRNGAPAFTLDAGDADQSVFGIGVTNLYYQDPLTDEVAPFNRAHMAEATRLGETLVEFDTIATPGVVQDIDAKDQETIGFLEMMANTQKPITLLISEPDSFETCLNLCDEIAGETATRTSLLPYFNPITPLILNEETSRKIKLCVDRGLAFIFSNYGMSGATCPITPGGTLALLTAELLSGLVYSQLLKQGAPVILGSLPAAFDMKTMRSYYTPQSMLINLSCAEMMTHYGIPHCGTSGGWMGRGPDLMASSMLWQNHLTSILGHPGLVPFVGNNFDSLAFSPSTVVYAAEIIRMARDFTTGFSIAPEEVGLDEIIRLGPGGSYLTAGLTMKKFREPLTKSDIWPFLALEQWQDSGSPKTGKELREHTRRLLDQMPVPEHHDEILAAGEAYLKSA